MDDLRPLSFVSARKAGPIPLFAAPDTTAIMERIFDYTFAPDATYVNRARVELKPVAANNTVFGVDFVRIPVMHGELEICGYRFGNAAYITDVSAIPESSLKLLQGVEVMVLSALRHEPHPSHATVEQALDWSRKIGARQTWFTHIAHDLGHEETNKLLPENVRLAYDGLSVPITL
jgi:phosphoribosyl 1,2-cyclic phosphate phosphodiesterase